MNKKGKISPFSIRLVGAFIGCIGFLLLAYRFSVIGTSLVGIGSVIIAAGEQ